jgi:toxin ParE1/3/4
MKYKVFLIADAERDIEEIYSFVSKNDSVAKAETLLKKLEDACCHLHEFPMRGHLPPELERIGVYEYQEIHYKPYRIIYQIFETSIFIYCVLDGRRNLQELLEKRLFR